MERDIKNNLENNQQSMVNENKSQSFINQSYMLNHSSQGQLFQNIQEKSILDSFINKNKHQDEEINLDTHENAISPNNTYIVQKYDENLQDSINLSFYGLKRGVNNQNKEQNCISNTNELEIQKIKNINIDLVQKNDQMQKNSICKQQYLDYKQNTQNSLGLRPKTPMSRGSKPRKSNLQNSTAKAQNSMQIQKLRNMIYLFVLVLRFTNKMINLLKFKHALDELNANHFEAINDISYISNKKGKNIQQSQNNIRIQSNPNLSGIMRSEKQFKLSSSPNKLSRDSEKPSLLRKMVGKLKQNLQKLENQIQVFMPTSWGFLIWDIIISSIILLRLYVASIRLGFEERLLDYNLTEKEYIAQYYPLIRLGFLVICIAHFVACFWHAVAYIQMTYYNVSGTWIQMQDYQNSKWYIRYLHSYYWAVSTMVTVLLYIPQTNLEMLFSILAILLTTGMFGYSINTIGLIVQEMDKKNKEFKKDMEKINRYMNAKKISQHLKQIVQNYMYYQYEQKLQRDKDDEEYSSGEIIFKPPTHGVLEIEDVDKEQQIGIFLIAEGEVEITFNQNKSIQTLGKDTIIGEKQFFTGQFYEFTAKSRGLCTIYKINRKSMLQVIKKDKKAYETYCLIRDSLMQKEENLFQLQCNLCEKEGHETVWCEKCQLQINKQKLIYDYSTFGFQSRIQSQRKKMKQKIFQDLEEIQICVEEICDERFYDQKIYEMIEFYDEYFDLIQFELEHNSNNNGSLNYYQQIVKGMKQTQVTNTNIDNSSQIEMIKQSTLRRRGQNLVEQRRRSSFFDQQFLEKAIQNQQRKKNTFKEIDEEKLMHSQGESDTNSKNKPPSNGDSPLKNINNIRRASLSQNSELTGQKNFKKVTSSNPYSNNNTSSTNTYQKQDSSVKYLKQLSHSTKKSKSFKEMTQQQFQQSKFDDNNDIIYKAFDKQKDYQYYWPQYNIKPTLKRFKYIEGKKHIKSKANSIYMPYLKSQKFFNSLNSVSLSNIESSQQLKSNDENRQKQLRKSSFFDQKTPKKAASSSQDLSSQEQKNEMNLYIQEKQWQMRKQKVIQQKKKCDSSQHSQQQSYNLNMQENGTKSVSFIPLNLNLQQQQDNNTSSSSMESSGTSYTQTQQGKLTPQSNWHPKVARSSSFKSYVSNYNSNLNNNNGAGSNLSISNNNSKVILSNNKK